MSQNNNYLNKQTTIRTYAEILEEMKRVKEAHNIKRKQENSQDSNFLHIHKFFSPSCSECHAERFFQWLCGDKPQSTITTAELEEQKDRALAEEYFFVNGEMPDPINDVDSAIASNEISLNKKKKRKVS